MGAATTTMTSEQEPLRVLLELTRVLTSEQPLEETLREVTAACLRLIRAEHASVRLFDSGQLLMKARSGDGIDNRPVRFERREGVLFWVLEHGEPALVDDVTSDPRFVSKPGQGFAIGSLLAVPMWSADTVVGVLSMSSPRTSAFGEQDLLLAQLIANCAAPSIGRARLRRLAITDAHTRAFNQGYLFVRLGEELERARAESRPVSLLSLDLDRFKQVNDRYGHPVGDEVLRTFADRVREAVRRCDVFVRRGGEEFVLILPGAGFDDAVATAERVRCTVASRPFLVGEGCDLRIEQTVSIGVAQWDGQETPQELEARSDRALYRAKDAGRNQVFAG